MVEGVQYGRLIELGNGNKTFVLTRRRNPNGLRKIVTQRFTSIEDAKSSVTIMERHLTQEFANSGSTSSEEGGSQVYGNMTQVVDDDDFVVNHFSLDNNTGF